MTTRLRRDQSVYRITGARRSLDDDVRSRQVRYAISMGIRTVCFVLALVTTGWLRWAMIFGAVALPYVAVVFANGGREPEPGMPHTLVTPSYRELEAGLGEPGDKPSDRG